MIDSQQLEELLKETKLSSMTDVIHFVLQQMLKLINFQPIQDLSARVAELEKPQGLDNIMLEEVKTLIQAMLQQKQDQIKKDLERTIQYSVNLALQQQNSRRSLRQIDLLEIVSKQNSQKSNINYQQKQMASNLQQSMIDSVKKQIAQIRLLLERKADRRQINDFRMQVQKELSQKMTLQETQKIVQKFQKDVFNKLTQTSNLLQKIEYDVKKSLMSQVTIMKKQLSDNFKMNQLKQKVLKLQKKLKRIDSQLKQQLQTQTQSIDITKRQSKQSVDQICNLIENLDYKIKSNAQQIETLSVNAANRNVKSGLVGGTWLAENKSNLKNMCISWEQQFLNEDTDLFKFQPGKSQIIVTEPGFYSLQCYISGCQKPPELIINSQAFAKVERSSSNRYLSYGLKQIVRLGQHTNRVSIKLQNQNNYTNAVFRLTRVA